MGQGTRLLLWVVGPVGFVPSADVYPCKKGVTLTRDAPLTQTIAVRTSFPTC